MPAYVIVEINVHDPVEYEEYKKLSPESLKAYQGKFIVRGGKTRILEGDWDPKRLAILEFPDSDHADAWYNSDFYQKIKAIRQRSTTSQMIMVEGY